MSLFDAYARLTDARFPPSELREIGERARQAGVAGGLVVGTSLESSRRAIQVAERLAPEWELWAAVGVHPAAAASLNEETITALHRMGQARRVRAVAAGLDLSPGAPPRRVQEPALEALLQISQWLEVPVVFHAGPGSGPRLIELIRANQALFEGGAIHDFEDSSEMLEGYLKLGLRISVSGRVTDRREGSRVRAALPSIPLDRLLIETDAPDHPPKPSTRSAGTRRETTRSEPAFLSDVLREVAHLRHTRAEPLGAALTENARCFFRLDSARA
jgi:TatD DNase family protein